MSLPRRLLQHLRLSIFVYYGVAIKRFTTLKKVIKIKLKSQKHAKRRNESQKSKEQYISLQNIMQTDAVNNNNYERYSFSQLWCQRTFLLLSDFVSLFFSICFIFSYTSQGFT